MDASVIYRPAQDSYVNQEHSSFMSSEVNGNKNGHFDSNAPDTMITDREGPEQILREEDLDEACHFIFPNRNEDEE